MKHKFTRTFFCKLITVWLVIFCLSQLPATAAPLNQLNHFCVIATNVLHVVNTPNNHPNSLSLGGAIAIALCLVLLTAAVIAIITWLNNLFKNVQPPPDPDDPGPPPQLTNTQPHFLLSSTGTYKTVTYTNGGVYWYYAQHNKFDANGHLIAWKFSSDTGTNITSSSNLVGNWKPALLITGWVSVFQAPALTNQWETQYVAQVISIVYDDWGNPLDTNWSTGLTATNLPNLPQNEPHKFYHYE